jgi:uncharacterized protein YndB with AHSA1/START domain
MTSMPHTGRSTVVGFPNALEIVLSRTFDAPIDLIFDVSTQPEHVRSTFAPFGEEVTVCDIDLKVGGSYHYVMVTDDGIECSFRGTFLEIERPRRTVQTWVFDGWPDVEAVESLELREVHGVTELTWRLRFTDQIGRDHMTRTDGPEANFETLDRYLRMLLELESPDIQ